MGVKSVEVAYAMALQYLVNKINLCFAQICSDIGVAKM